MGTPTVAPPLPPDEPEAPDDPDVIDPEPDPGRPGPSPSPDPIRWPPPGSPDNPVHDESHRGGGVMTIESRSVLVFLAAFRKWPDRL
jgi:hypothetical protein